MSTPSHSDASPQSGATIVSVDRSSLAWKVGIRPGDVILRIETEPAEDILQLMWAAQEGEVHLEVRRKGQVIQFDLPIDPLCGIGFETADSLFDGIRRCPNSCVFCFVDQQPPRLRDTLYVKDEDYRLSFLTGSYVTLTNLRSRDLDRIEDLHLSPLYVSIHATDEAVRRKLLMRRRLPPLLPIIDRLGEAGISFHAQIVLVPGWNDGAVLERTLRDVIDRHPVIMGTAVVPVGLTRHRKGLPSLAGLTTRQARAALRTIDTMRRTARTRFGQGLVYAADELFLQAKRPIPSAAYYDDPALLENGVGLLRRFLDGARRLAARHPQRPRARGPATALVTGKAAARFFRQSILPLFRPLGIPPTTVIAVSNEFFGHSVTVAGLLSGQDIARAITRPYGRVLVPACALKVGTKVFLDEMTTDELSDRIGAPVTVVENSPAHLLKTLLSVS